MFRIACTSIFRHGATALVLAAGVLAAGTTLAPRSAEAAVAANFQGYCNRHYPNSTFQIQFTQWGPRYLCRQVNVYGATLQNIDAGAVCREQTGNAAFKAYGRQVQCNGQVARQNVPNYNQQRLQQRQANRNWATLRAQQGTKWATPRAQQANRNQGTRQLPPAYRTVVPNLNAYCARVWRGSIPGVVPGNNFVCWQRQTGQRIALNPAAACQATTGRPNYNIGVNGNGRYIICL